MQQQDPLLSQVIGCELSTEVHCVAGPTIDSESMAVYRNKVLLKKWSQRQTKANVQRLIITVTYPPYIFNVLTEVNEHVTPHVHRLVSIWDIVQLAHNGHK